MMPLLGTFVRIELRSPTASAEELNALAQSCFDRIQCIQRKMSYFETESDVTRFNRAHAGAKLQIDSETAEVLTYAEELRIESNGAFNVGTAGNESLYQILHEKGLCYVRKLWDGEIDLGGIAKGFAVDAAYALVQSHLNANEIFGSVNAGGDLFLFESEEVDLPIQIGVAGEVHYRMVKVKSGAIATSSVRPEVQYRNPLTGSNVLHAMTATVLAPRAMHADALTKLVMVHQVQSDDSVLERCFDRYSARGFHAVH